MDGLNMTLIEASQAIRRREVSSLELTQAAIARAHRLQPDFNAFVRFDEEQALAGARRCDQDLHRGLPVQPLQGLPLAHKDMFYRRGLISTCGSKLREHWVADTTATVLEKIDASGAVQIGTLNMTEFAYGPTGQNAFLGDARNPWNPAHISGGSSSGSAIATAARIVFGALGSDTAGSVRMPASLCGITGMKTTLGLVSRAGCMPLSGSLDTIGPLTRTVADNAQLLSVIAGHDPRDGVSAHSNLGIPGTPEHIFNRAVALGQRGSLTGLRVGWPLGYFDENLDVQVSALLTQAARQFAALGAEIIEVPMPDLEAVNAVGMILNWGDVLALHGANMRERVDGYSAQTRGRIEVALAAGVQDYIDAQRSRGMLLREFVASVFNYCDVLLTPTLAFPTPALADVDVAGGPKMMKILDEITRLMRPVNVLGLPALALPCGFTEQCLPYGMQLIARPFGESLLYRMGSAYQAHTDWHVKSPVGLCL